MRPLAARGLCPRRIGGARFVAIEDKRRQGIHRPLQRFAPARGNQAEIGVGIGATTVKIVKALVSIQEHLESLESHVIRCRQTDSPELPHVDH